LISHEDFYQIQRLKGKFLSCTFYLDSSFDQIQ